MDETETLVFFFFFFSSSLTYETLMLINFLLQEEIPINIHLYTASGSMQFSVMTIREQYAPKLENGPDAKQLNDLVYKISDATLFSVINIILLYYLLMSL